MKSKPFTEVRSNRFKKKYKTTISKIPKNKDKIKIKGVERTGSACTKTKNYMSLQKNE